MSADDLLALVVFAVVASITPGPNNFMLLASGVNFGLRRTLPHMLGISVGGMTLLLAVGAGLGAVLAAYPALSTAMKAVSAAYLVYLAWKIAVSSGTAKAGPEAARPLGFLDAAMFQWVNPKAWAISLVVMGAYTSAERPLVSVVLVTIVFTLAAAPSLPIWTGFGMGLRRFLADPRRLRAFNILMGVALLATIPPLLMG